MKAPEPAKSIFQDISSFSWEALFMHRLTTWLREQWKVLRTAVDWIIALYFIVPAFIAAGIIYTSWWKQAPEWLTVIPFQWFVLALFIFTLMFKVRSFLEPADQVFLQQHPSALDIIRRLGLCYSMAIAAITTIGLFFILSPLLVRGYGMAMFHVILFAGYTYAWKLIVPLITETIYLRIKGWISYVWNSAVIIASACLFVFSSDLFLVRTSAALTDQMTGRLLHLLLPILLVTAGGFVAYIAIRLRMGIKGILHYEIEKERRARMRLTAFLLARAGIREERSLSKERRPLLFRRSQRLIRRRDKEALLMESVIKSYIRSSDQWFFIFKFTGLAFSAIHLTSGWVSLIVYSGLIFLLYQGIRSYCIYAVNMSYLDLFHWTKEERLLAMDRAILRLGLPVAVLLLVVLILTW